MEARKTLQSEFRRSHSSGAAKAVQLLDVHASALGQHLQSESGQRGLHGTAAAILVLAEDDSASGRDVLRRCIYYVEHRLIIEKASSDVAAAASKVLRNDSNVVKLAELLYSLTRVKAGVVPTEAIRGDIAERLTAGKNPDGGWPYFIGSSGGSELLATTFATRALAAHGGQVNDGFEYLRAGLRKEAASQSDVSVRVAALFVLCFAEGGERTADNSEHREAFESLWARLAPLLDQNLESNIEYALGDRNYYVRIPWQLLLTCISVRISPYGRFVSRPLQSLLSKVIGEVRESGGLIYPHSGDKLSTRTNAYVYDVLGLLEAELDKNRPLLRASSVLKRLRALLSSKLFVSAVRSVSAALAGILLVQYIRSPERDLTAVAPELLAAMLVFLVTWGSAD